MLRPDAEQTPNRLGVTLAELRTSMEEAVVDLMRARSDSGSRSGSGSGSGDKRLALLPGRDLIGPEQLADGVHPDDKGHAALAAAVAEALRTTLSSSRSGDT